MKEWVKNWIRSKKPNKQRKYVYNAPLHIQHKLVNVHLSPELRKKYGKRNIGVRKEDQVKILRGQFKGKTGKVVAVNLKKQKVNIEGIENIRKEGTKAYYPLQPSNLMITELFLDDKKRKELLERKSKKAVTKEVKKPVKEKKE
ncbi:MAG: 50S ribosomal protein L24 [Nanoarchaeota archaeon]|nr:50S ribosomal protein L24 [Nanoarchaeota archaeon]MBU4241879.1 50S ribosomal protein L24 [Nanoarchaeota archaeon]MBU4352467.1 50S ribosomal protein L24 [Nanoarchaeota archaeon]MBU4456004.1 50S ribosomal protein L24 [Nanoarchaeota archaeon]MCG2719423.1 50S ribosomal protein L24 [Nanoarchaeota archaeon]